MAVSRVIEELKRLHQAAGHNRLVVADDGNHDVRVQTVSGDRVGTFHRPQDALLFALIVNHGAEIVEKLRNNEDIR